MIVIVDDSFKITVGTTVLDRAVVCVLGIDAREDRRGSPSLRADIAYGVEVPGVGFQRHDYDSRVSTLAKYIEAREWPGRIRQPHLHPKGQATGADIMFNMILWAEQIFVEQGLFGPRATISPNKRPKTLLV